MAWNEPGNSGRDPWTQGSNRKGGAGPQVLEQWLRRLRNQWNGRGSAGGRASLGLAVVAFAAALWLLSGFYTVDEKDRGAVLRFGAFVRTAEPGLHWHLPWPVEKVIRVDVTQVHQARESATVLTRDGNVADVELQVQYRYAGPEEFLFNNADADSTVQAAAGTALTQVAGGTDVDTLIGDGRPALGPRVQQTMQQLLTGYRAGINITDVSVQKIEPPDSLKAAFADAIAAREDGDRMRAEARTDAGSRLPSARGEAAEKLAQATAYRDQSIARAEGDVARFQAVLEQYRKSPRVTRERLYIDTMSAIYAGTTKVMIDADKASPVIYLPLEELLRNLPKADAPRSDAQAAIPQPPLRAAPVPNLAPSNPALPPSTPSSGNSGSDPNRSRDRGSR